MDFGDAAGAEITRELVKPKLSRCGFQGFGEEKRRPEVSTTGAPYEEKIYSMISDATWKGTGRCYKELGLQSMPEGIGVIENRSGRVRLLLGAGYSTYLVEGTDLKHLTSLPRLVLGPGEPGEFDNGAAQVFAVVRSNSRLYAFYQAQDSEGLPANTLFGVSGFYLSIGLAESDDDGYTWAKKGQIILTGSSLSTGQQFLSTSRHTDRIAS